MSFDALFNSESKKVSMWEGILFPFNLEERTINMHAVIRKTRFFLLTQVTSIIYRPYYQVTYQRIYHKIYKIINSKTFKSKSNKTYNKHFMMYYSRVQLHTREHFFGETCSNKMGEGLPTGGSA